MLYGVVVLLRDVLQTCQEDSLLLDVVVEVYGIVVLLDQTDLQVKCQFMSVEGWAYMK